jgi:hypothetical protein
VSTRTCPVCGAEYLASVATCADCGVALAGPDDGAAADLGALEHDGVAYLLDDWGPHEREELSAVLRGERVPFLWEGDELVVPETRADLVEELIDHLDHPDALEPEDDDGDGGATLLSSLFVVADVLTGDPDNPPAVAELLQAAAEVEERTPPFGLDPALWSTIGQRAAALVGALGAGADEAAVVEAARALREAVRPLV